MTLDQLFHHRTQGRRPDGTVVLALSGPIHNLPEDMIQIECRHNPDIRGCADLDVVIAHDGSKAAEAVEIADLLITFHVKNLITWITSTNRATHVVFEGSIWLKEIEEPWA